MGVIGRAYVFLNYIVLHVYTKCAPSGRMEC